MQTKLYLLPNKFMQQDYYIEYFDLERHHWWFTARLRILETLTRQLTAKQNEPLKILNVGAATGATSQMLAKFGTVTSVEYDKDCCDFVFQKAGLQYVNASIENLPFDADSFDMVCAFDVIEHVKGDSKSVSELTRVCKQGGNIFATVPAFNFLWGVHDEVNHHVKRYTMNSFVKLFELPMTPVYKSYFNFFLFIPIAIARILFRIFPKIIKRKGSGVDNYVLNQSKFNNVFHRIFLAEEFFLKKRISLPFGVSILVVFTKK